MDIWGGGGAIRGWHFCRRDQRHAGGSSFITFPLLLSTGLPPFAAAITNYIALIPSNCVALLGYRAELARVRHKLATPLTIAAVGGFIGSMLLLWSGAAVFARMVPWLFLAATALFALGTWIKARLRHRPPLAGRGWKGVSLFLQFLLALYGGFFGAAMGFVLLACLNIFDYDDLHEANTVKNAFISVFSLIGAAIFLTTPARRRSRRQSGLALEARQSCRRLVVCCRKGEGHASNRSPT